MEREIMSQLEEWKRDKYKKPLLLTGPRQVGKTWLMKAFGEANFEKVVYVNFEQNKPLQKLFEKDFNIERILLALQIQTGVIPEKENTLIILDEIQESKGGITALKYFREEVAGYAVIGAGSLLGVALNEQSFPVGQVTFMEVSPLNFSEFLMAMGAHDLLQLLTNQDWDMIKTFHSRFRQLLREYFLVGGMPEVVHAYAQKKDFKKVKKIQQDILKSFDRDFSKHAPYPIVPRIRQLWDNLPRQLSRENKKFVYGLVKEGARAREYEIAIAWLENYGLIRRIYRVNKPGLPLKSYRDLKSFKLYALDVGLLCELSDLNEKIILEENRLFTEFKGALTEQFVLQELVSEAGYIPYYWSNKNSGNEIDFIISHENEGYPIEVKAGVNLQSKSLKSFADKFHPPKSILTALSSYKENDELLCIPLYAIGKLKKVLKFSSDYRNQ